MLYNGRGMILRSLIFKPRCKEYKNYLNKYCCFHNAAFPLYFSHLIKSSFLIFLYIFKFFFIRSTNQYLLKRILNL